MPRDESSGATTSDTDVITETIVVTKRPWNVVVWDDPVTPMSVVVVIFRRIFGYSVNKATQLMLTVHQGPRDRVVGRT